MFSDHLFWCFPNALDKEACDEIISLGDAAVLQDARVGSQRGDSGELNQKIRDTKIAWLDNDQVKDVARELITAANYGAEWDLEWTGFNIAQYGVYEPGMHYKFHKDAMQIGSRARKLSLAISLNSDYEGGNFVIKAPDGKNVVLGTMRDVGCAVVFPSTLYHTVEPVTAGVRKSLVVWALGPKFR